MYWSEKKKAPLRYDQGGLLHTYHCVMIVCEND